MGLAKACLQIRLTAIDYNMKRAQGTRPEPGGEHLAIYACKLALQPHLRTLLHHRRSSLRGKEKAHTGARQDKIRRNARLGACGSERVAVGIP